MLDFTQSQIYLVPSLGGIGVYFGTEEFGRSRFLVSGPCGPSTPTKADFLCLLWILIAGAIVFGMMMDKLGAWPTALAAGAFLFLGWSLICAASMKLITYRPEVLGLFYAIQQFGAQGAYYAALVGNLGNFKLKHRGTITGVLVSAYGLSAFVISQIYTRVFTSEPTSLFAFMACVTLAVCLTGACAIQRIQPQSTKLALAARLLTIQQTNGMLSDDGGSGLISDYEGNISEASKNSSSPNFNSPAVDPAPTNVPRYGQLRYLTLLKSVDFWLLSAIGFCTAGSGLNFITAVGSIAESWGLTTAPYNIPASTFTSVLAICNCAGRLIYGVSNDAFRGKIRNVSYLIPISVLIGLAQFMMIFWNSVPALFIGVVLTGMSYGGFFATIAIIFNRYFGDVNYSTNLGFKTLVLSFSGLIFGQISGKLADHFAVKGHHCVGTLCYRYTFIIAAALCTISTILAIIVNWRERRDDRRKAEEEAIYATAN